MEAKITSWTPTATGARTTQSPHKNPRSAGPSPTATANANARSRHPSPTPRHRHPRQSTFRCLPLKMMKNILQSSTSAATPTKILHIRQPNRNTRHRHHQGQNHHRHRVPRSTAVYHHRHHRLPVDAATCAGRIVPVHPTPLSVITHDRRHHRRLPRPSRQSTCHSHRHMCQPHQTTRHAHRHRSQSTTQPSRMRHHHMRRRHHHRRAN